MYKNVGTPPYRGEILSEHNKFVKKISARTKTSPSKHFQYDKQGLSYWKVNSPDYYKNNPEKFNENVAVSDFIDGILLTWNDMTTIGNQNTYMMVIEITNPRLDFLKKLEKEDIEASNIF